MRPARSSARCLRSSAFASPGPRTRTTTSRRATTRRRCGSRRSPWPWAPSCCWSRWSTTWSAWRAASRCRRPRATRRSGWSSAMDMLITALLIALLFALLGSGLWIGLSLLGVAWIGMELFTTRPVGDAMAVTIWGSVSSWTLTALPLFVWMGEILFRTRLSEDMFRGLAPWLERVPGRLLHTNILGCTIFAAVSGSSAATCATIGKMTLPELAARGYPAGVTVGTLAGAGTLGLLIPPSIIMIVYGVAANVSIAQLFIAGILPGVLLAALFSGYIVLWALTHPGRVPALTERTSFVEKIAASRHLIPVLLLIGAVLGSIYAGVATATEAAAFGVVGALVISAAQRSLDWTTFRDSLLGATRT